MATARAILVTDLVDSTALAARLSAEAASALGARMDAAVRGAIAAHGGREIDKTDGFLVVFDDVSAALACARAVHAALAEVGAAEGLDLVARAGIHRAPIVLRENPPEHVARGAKRTEAEGVGKSVAARLAAAAPGGRTLLTADARAALPDDARVTSLGHWQLKGLAAPVEIWEDGPPTELLRDGPKHWRVVREGEQWVPATAIPRRLPRERDGFFGRESDLHQIAVALDGTGFATILGPGGVGKTRLACRFAWTHLGEWHGGAWFCDLSAARDAADVAAEVSRVLDLPVSADPIRQVGEALRARGDALLVLDNAENAVDAVATALSRWLDAAPAAGFLVTSREALRITGETAIPLESLDDAAAAALFVERATAADPSFAAADHAAAIAEITRRLDGMPLAIELAAARIRVLPPGKLLERLSRRFDVLTGGRRDVPRHASLRAAIDFSWDLLDEPERRALAQLAVFAGSFDAAAVEGILQLDAGDPQPLDVLEALVDKSLVRRLAHGRLALFPTIAEYAAERLSPDERRDAERRHREWYARRDPRLRGPGAVDRLATLEADAENLAAAVQRALDAGETATAAAACDALAELARRRPFVQLALPLIERTAATPYLDPALRRRLICRACMLDPRHASVDRMLEVAREANEAKDAAGEALALQTLLWASNKVGRHEDGREAVRRLEELLAGLADWSDRSRAYMSISAWLQSDGKLHESLERAERALKIATEDDDPWTRGAMLSNAGWILGELGQFDVARERLEASLLIHREVGHLQNLARATGKLGTLAARQGHLDEAAGRYEEARRIAASCGDLLDWNQATSNLSYVRTSQGRHDEAVALAKEALASAERLGQKFALSQSAMKMAQALSHRGDHEDALAAIQRAVALAREMGAPAPYMANVLGVWSDVLTRSGDPYEAVVPLQEALVLARDAGHPLAITNVLIWLSDAYHAIGDMGRSRLYAQDAMAVATGAELEEATMRYSRARKG
jgi:predicted ATPase/class 3 adenylate cyclase